MAKHKVRKVPRKRRMLDDRRQKEIEDVETDRGPLAFGYRRCSHLKSKESGTGLGVQQERINAYATMLLIDHPELTLADTHEDNDDLVVSAWKFDFRSRKGARNLLAQVQRGDHIIVAEMSRAFRNVVDCRKTITYLTNRGITLHFADLKVDLSSAQGRFTISILAVVSEWYSDQLSERSKAIAAHKKRLGLVAGGQPGAGWRFAGPKGRRVKVPNPPDWPIMELIVDLRENEHLSWEEISDRVEVHLAEKEGRECRRATHADRGWLLDTCSRAYKTLVEWRKKQKNGVGLVKS